MDKGTIEDWVSRGEVVCAGLMEKAEEVLKKAETREEAEARIRIMESHLRGRAIARSWQN